MKTNNGFTLVEIAIVLIIIGLFIGTILKGTELITNAKIKNIENNFSSVARAITIYRESYNQLPGDDVNANRFKSGLDIGDRNGVIDGNFDSTLNTDESRKLWLHLRYANLVDRISGGTGTYDDDQKKQPKNAFGGLIGVSSDSSSTINGNDNKAQWNTTNNMALFVGFTKIPGNIAAILESHSDDEQANLGRIRSDQPNYDGDYGTGKKEHKMYFSL